jgi:hypothetical protein
MQAMTAAANREGIDERMAMSSTTGAAKPLPGRQRQGVPAARYDKQDRCRGEKSAANQAVSGLAAAAIGWSRLIPSSIPTARCRCSTISIVAPSKWKKWNTGTDRC